jgi:hypothetical protein
MQELDTAIQDLEQKQVNELEIIKGQLKTIYESTKPINILKNSINEIIYNLKSQDNLIDNALLLGVNYVSNKVKSKSVGMLPNIIFSFIEFAILRHIPKK